MLTEDDLNEMHEDILAMQKELADKKKHCERQSMQGYVQQYKHVRKQTMPSNKN